MNNKKFFVLGASVFCTMLLTYCTNNRKESSQFDQSIYAIINDIFLDTALNLSKDGYKVVADVNTLPAPFYTGTELQFIAENLLESDTSFLKLQIKNKNGFKLDSLTAFGFKILKLSSLREAKLSSDSLWNYINTQYGDGYFSISRPIFNKSRDLLYIKIGFTCGYYCGGGGAFIFERKNNRWQLKETLSSWMS